MTGEMLSGYLKGEWLRSQKNNPLCGWKGCIMSRQQNAIYKYFKKYL